MKASKKQGKPQARGRSLHPVVRFKIPPFWKAAGWLVIVAAQFGPPYEAELWPDRTIDILLRAGIAFIAANYAVGAMVAAFKSNPGVHPRAALRRP